MRSVGSDQLVNPTKLSRIVIITSKNYPQTKIHKNSSGGRRSALDRGAVTAAHSRLPVAWFYWGGWWGWLGSRVVSVLDSGAEGPGFKSQSRRCRVTVLGKLFTPILGWGRMKWEKRENGTTIRAWGQGIMTEMGAGRVWRKIGAPAQGLTSLGPDLQNILRFIVRLS